MKKLKNKWLIIIAVVALLAVVISLPPVWSRVVYHSRAAYTSIKYWLNPPSEAIFVPSTEKTASATASNELLPIQTQSAVEPTLAPTVSTIPLPPSVMLTGVTCEAQLWNNCGPATLSMYLSFYNWGKSQIEVATKLKPNERDLNVMPYELADFVNENTEQRALWRYGGDPQTIKALLAAGIPVMIEKSFQPYNIRNDGWLGHYNLIVGYHDDHKVFTVHDPYLLIYTPWGGRVEPEDFDTFTGFDYFYDKLDQDWRSFNFVFIVVYPPEKENEVLNILGPLATEKDACRKAYDNAIQETTSLTETRDKFFSWFNTGTSLVCLEDYDAAAAAYDTAFGIYPEIKQEDRPFRILWYEVGPYAAYYHTGRYQDVIDLADQTLNNMGEPLLEESYYWKALSYNALGETDKAIANLRTSLKCHPGYKPSLTMLEQLGVAP